MAVQVSGPPPLQLYVLPQHRYRCCCRGRRPERGGAGGGAGGGPCTWLVQAVFCIAGLATIILVLALVGAAAFHATEGPHEDQQVHQLNKQQVSASQGHSLGHSLDTWTRSRSVNTYL